MKNYQLKRRSPTVGEAIPDLDLFAADASSVRLSDFVTGPTLLIFLRHLA